jgi:prepilin-type N-terminal cleavage/methylation domain-containing protein
MSKAKNRNLRGFSILELMIAMAIFLILSGSVIGGLGRLQGNYRSAEIRTTMQQRLRGTMELMAQEIGQAGLEASTVDGNAVDTSTSAPWTLSAITATGSQTVTITTASTGVFPYNGQWLQVPAGTKTGGTPCTVPDAIQVTGVAASSGLTTTATATLGCLHPAGTPIYPMGVFPHGIVAGTTGDPSTYANLAIYGEFNGPGNGLWAVEYTCPTTTPGSLTRKEWSLASASTASGTPTTYSLIDNVTCYFCWPGTTNTYASCPTGTTVPDSVSLVCPAGTCTYSMIPQVGFTITASETANISGSAQTISATKSYSNIQPRNIIAADNIYKTACASATNSGTSCTAASSLSKWLYGELQPDPPNLSLVQW